MNTRQIAEKIASELFVNGSGEKADRLALMQNQGNHPERYLGGWSKNAATDVIERALSNAVAGPPSRSKKQKIEDELRRSDLTAQITDRQDIEYGHHESLPRGEHVSRLRKSK